MALVSHSSNFHHWPLLASVALGWLSWFKFCHPIVRSLPGLTPLLRVSNSLSSLSTSLPRSRLALVALSPVFSFLSLKQDSCYWSLNFHLIFTWGWQEMVIWTGSSLECVCCPGWSCSWSIFCSTWQSFFSEACTESRTWRCRPSPHDLREHRSGDLCSWRNEFPWSTSF